MAERLVFHDRIVYEAEKGGFGYTIGKAIKRALGIVENPPSLASQVTSALIGSDDKGPSRVGNAIQSALIGSLSGEKQKQVPSSPNQQPAVGTPKESTRPGVVQTYTEHVANEVGRVLRGNASAQGKVDGRTIGDQIWETLVPEGKQKEPKAQALVVKVVPNQPERSTNVPALPSGQEKK